MTTSVLINRHVIPAWRSVIGYDIKYNWMALLSQVCCGLFLIYFVFPHTGLFRFFSKYAVAFVLYAPLVALVCSVTSTKQIIERGERGATLNYIVFTITYLYFIVILSLFIGLTVFSLWHGHLFY